MSQSAPSPRCSYYFEPVAKIPQLVGLNPIDVCVPLCEILVSLDGAGTIAAGIRKLQICDDMMRVGGGPRETTRCQFAGEKPCPYFDP